MRKALQFGILVVLVVVAVFTMAPLKPDVDTYTTYWSRYWLRNADSPSNALALLTTLDAWTNSANSVFVINGSETNDPAVIQKMGYLAGDGADDTWPNPDTNQPTLFWGRSMYIGPWAGQNSGKGGRNLMIGHRVGSGASNTVQSTIIGFGAAIDASDVRNSTILGNRAGGKYTGGAANDISYSVLIGNEAGRYAGDLYYSTFVGAEAGYDRTNAYQSTFIGCNAGRGTGSIHDSIAIGFNANPSASYQTVIGNTNTVQAIMFGNHFLKTNSAPTVTGTDIALWNSNGTLYAVSASATNQLLP